MADLTELEVATKENFMPVVTQQIYKQSPILSRIFKIAQEGKFGMAAPSYDGRKIVEPLEIADVAVAGAYKTADTWNPGTTEVLTGAAFDWRMYYISLKIHNKDVEANKGASRMIDIAAVKFQNAVRVIRKSLATDFYGSQDDTDVNERMIGIGAICAADKTIGSLAQGSHAWWQGQIDTAEGNRSLTWKLMNAMYYKTKWYGNSEPATLIVCSEGVLQDYEDSLTKVAEAAPSPLVQIATMMSKGPKTIDGGYDAFFFKQIPMVADPFCPANTMYFLNENYLKWRLLKAFSATGWAQLRDQGKDWMQNTIFGYGALTTSAPNKQGVIEALTEA